MPPIPPTDPAEELLAEVEQLDPEAVRLRLWKEEQMVAAGVGDFAAMQLSFIPGVDYRRVVHMHELGMTDDLILDEYLD